MGHEQQSVLLNASPNFPITTIISQIKVTETYELDGQILIPASFLQRCFEVDSVSFDIVIKQNFESHRSALPFAVGW